MPRKVPAVAAIAAFVLFGVASIHTMQAARPVQGGGTRQIPSGGTTSIGPSLEGSDQLQQPELSPGIEGEEGAGGFNRPRPGFKNGKFPKKPLDAPTVSSSAVAPTNPELALSVDGLNHRQQR